MDFSDSAQPSSRRRAERFCTTQWHLVVSAARQQTPEARLALATLCETYWYPLYAYVRRQGHSPAEAQDLTQEFFVRLLERNPLAVADRDRGRFRSFLLASLNHFLHNQWRHNAAQKRGGTKRNVSLDFRNGEKRFELEPSHELTAEKLYERSWAMTLIEQVIGKLGDEYAAGSKQERFLRLRPYLGGETDSVPYRQLAGDLQMTEGAVKVAVHRLRRRCRELLRAAIAQTVAGPEDIDEELHELFQALGRKKSRGL